MIYTEVLASIQVLFSMLIVPALVYIIKLEKRIVLLEFKVEQILEKI